MQPISHQLPLGGGRSLHVVEAGSGPPLVLIHGALVTHHDWLEGPFATLAASHRALAVDRPGHGRSERPRFLASPHAQAEQIRSGLALLDVRRPIVVAHSFGGLVALAWAAAHAEELAGMVLLAPIAFHEFRPVEQGLFSPRALPFTGPLLSMAGERTVDPAILRSLQELMFKPQKPPAHWLDSFPYDEVLAAESMVREGEDAATVLPGSPLAWIDLKRATVPTIILSGDRDLVVDPSRHAKPLAEKLPCAELATLPGVGHMLHHAEPGRVLEAVASLSVPA